jgi:hypothetical protein
MNLTQEDLDTLWIVLSEMEFTSCIPSGLVTQYFKPCTDNCWTVLNSEVSSILRLMMIKGRNFMSREILIGEAALDMLSGSV